MSPEQANGKAVDKRADIWAFGSVLYECLTGKRAFQGDTITEIVSSILKSEPDWQALPPTTPRRVKNLLHQCLTKDPRERLHDIGDARIEIKEALEEPVEAVDATVAGLRPGRLRMGLVLAAVLVLGAAIGIMLKRTLAPGLEHPTPVVRSSISLSAWGLGLTDEGSMAISPDGETIVFRARGADAVRLYVRRVGEWEPRPLKGTEGATKPFFSPDGEWIAFSTSQGMQKIPVRGESPQLICKVGADYGGSWGRDGRIIFGSSDVGLYRVAEGSPPQPLTRLPEELGSLRYMWPGLLPGGEAALFTIWREGHASIAALYLRTGEIRPLVETGTRARYITTGHLIYESGGHLWAVPFDPERLETRGASRIVIDDVGIDTFGNAIYDVSATGTLAYMQASTSLARLVWKDRAGNTVPLKLRPRRYSMPALSPDGRRFIDTIQEGPARNLWIGSVDGEPMTRLTFGNDDWFSLFAPDGRVFFTGGQNGQYNIFSTLIGTGKAERITNTTHAQKATSWLPGGKVILFNEIRGSGTTDIMQMEADRPETARPFANDTGFNELNGSFSPDGHWVAYSSNESGIYEVYVQAYSGPGTRSQVSVDGGVGPVWHPKGGELFYQSPTAVMAVRVANGLSVGPPTPVFAHPRGQRPDVDWDVAPDGQRFLVVEHGSPSQINLVSQWFEELKRLVPTGKK
jgi:Tol biopolymer transport system component